MMEEIEELYYQYGKRSYVWVDESWNIDPKFNIEFSEAMIRSGMKTKWMTFMRADCVVRDHKKASWVRKSGGAEPHPHRS